MPAIRLAPLGAYAEMSHSDFTATDVSGRLITINAGNANDDFPSSPRNFFYLSCDPEDYTGNLRANDVFTIAANNGDAFLLILYSTHSEHCTATGLNNLPSLASILTTTEPMVAEMLANLDLSVDSPGTATLLPDLNAYTNGSDSGGRRWGGYSQGPNGSPTTAVAMIILYSITGVITALFVTIIITGAIRAHRHPERYGPRAVGVGGRRRQGRARGIARAVVDTLPIVKFGERDGDGGAGSGAPKPASVSNSATEGNAANESTRGGDIEMTAGSDPSSTSNDAVPNKAADSGAGLAGAATGTTAAVSATQEDSPSSSSTPANPNASSATQSDASKATTSGGPMPIAGASEENAPSCSICTEDFVVGSDLRVLPCNHRFHPECVDPWLLNVSGTCPLCRIDLRPKDAEGNEEDAPEGTSADRGGLDDSAASGPGRDSADSTVRSGSVSAGGFRPGEDHIMAFSLRSGRTRGASNTPRAGEGAESAGALAGLRRAMAGSREERVAALRRFREQRRAEAEGEGGSGPEEAEERRGLARRLRERLRVRTERRESEAQTLGQIRSREHVDGRPV